MDATSRCSTLKAGFGQVYITLDAAQDFVVDGLFVAQGDDGVAFCSHRGCLVLSSLTGLCCVDGQTPTLKRWATFRTKKC